MSFEEYLISKKIDSVALHHAEPVLWQEWKMLFGQMSPASFTSQKLYLINPLRRKYLLKEVPTPVIVAEKKNEEPEVAAVVKSSKPVFKPKIK
ncbi:MAG: hypothetical protein DI538_09685 [Azospira oryzae]|nr:MAG: hypothetical protein DI538_09685 [Azospira oryzae]